MTAPTHIKRWAGITSVLLVLGACLWFAFLGLFIVTQWPAVLGVLIGLTSLQGVLAIASAAVLRRMSRLSDNSRTWLLAVFAFGMLPILISAGVVMTGLGSYFINIIND